MTAEPPPPLSLRLRWRLSLLMFLQFAVLGSWSVSLPTWLLTSAGDGGLHFPEGYAFWVYSTLAFGGLCAPVLNSLLADRLFRCDRLLVALHLGGAVLLATAALTADHHAPRIRAAFDSLAASEEVAGVPLPALLAERAELLRRRDADPSRLRELDDHAADAARRLADRPPLRSAVAAAFPPLFALLLVYNVAGMVTMTLTTTLCLRHLPDADRHFPTVRLWGTVGWIASGLAVGVLIRAVSAEPLWLAAGVSLGLGLFALVLPATPPSGHRRSLADTLGLPAAGVFARGPLLVFAVCAVLATLLNSFYAFGFNKFLADLHLPSPTALQTIGQVSEVVFMALIPWALSRIGLKWLMVLGLAGWLLRYLVFLTESRPLIVLVGLPLHGFSHSFFFVAAMPFVDRNAPRHLRAGTQGMLTFLSMGLGLLPGNWLASEVIALCRLPSGVDWPRVWVVPAALALGTLALFAACFRVPARPAPIPEGIPAPGADGPVPVPPALEAGEPV